MHADNPLMMLIHTPVDTSMSVPGYDHDALVAHLAPAADPERRHEATRRVVDAIQGGETGLIPLLAQGQHKMLRRVFRETGDSSISAEERGAVVVEAFVEAVGAVDTTNKIGPWLRWRIHKLVLDWVKQESAFRASVRADIDRLVDTSPEGVRVEIAGEVELWRTADLERVARDADVSDADLALVLRRRVEGEPWGAIALEHLGGSADADAVAVEIGRLRKRCQRTLARMRACAQGKVPRERRD